jgi:glycosyltransferase involved in cell wall biosynthesis
MKICILTENYYKGGLDTFLINLFNSWEEASHEIILECNETHPGLDDIVMKTSRSIILRAYKTPIFNLLLKIKKMKGIGRKLFYLPANLFFKFIKYPIIFPAYIFVLTHHFLNTKYDRLMVVNGGYPGSLYCRAAVIAWKISGANYPAIFNIHNLVMPTSILSRPFEFIINNLIASCSGQIVGVSKSCIDSFKDLPEFQRLQNIKYIYNGIKDPRELIITSPSSSIDAPTKKYCLMLGTYEPRKGHAYMLNAFKKVVLEIPDILLKIYGYGSTEEKQTVRAEIISLGLEQNVILGDFLEDTADLIFGAEILLVPSQSHESFGLTIIEAMALGVPVVATNVGGIPEVLSDSCAGYVCSKLSTDEFAFSILKILRDKDLAIELGVMGRTFYEERFQAHEMVKKYKELFMYQNGEICEK